MKKIKNYLFLRIEQLIKQEKEAEAGRIEKEEEKRFFLRLSDGKRGGGAGEFIGMSSL